MPITLLSSWCLHAERNQRLETKWRGLGEGVEGLRVSMDALVFDYWEHLPVCVLNALLGTHWSTGICQYQTLLTDIVLRWHLPMSVVMGISITYCYTNSEFNHGCMHVYYCYVYYCYITRRWRDKQQAGRTDRDRHGKHWYKHLWFSDMWCVPVKNLPNTYFGSKHIYDMICVH